MNTAIFNHLKPDCLTYIYDNSSYFPPRDLRSAPSSERQVAQDLTQHKIDKFYQNYCRYFTEQFPINTSRISFRNLKIKIDDYIRHTEEQGNIYERFKIALQFDKSPEHIAFWLEAGIVPSTPTLNFALQHGQPIETIRLLLSRGAKPSASSLALAATSTQGLEKTELLLKAGAKPNTETLSFIISKKSYYMPSDLYNEDDIECLRLLLKHRFSIEDGMLDLAIAENHPPSVIKILIKAGAEITGGTVSSLLSKRYPSETIHFVMKEIDKLVVVEIEDDNPQIETQVPFFNEASLNAMRGLAISRDYPKEMLALFL